MSGTGIAARAWVMTCAVPSLVKTAPNTLEATARKITTPAVIMVMTAAFFSTLNDSLP